MPRHLRHPEARLAYQGKPLAPIKHVWLVIACHRDKSKRAFVGRAGSYEEAKARLAEYFEYDWDDRLSHGWVKQVL